MSLYLLFSKVDYNFNSVLAEASVFVDFGILSLSQPWVGLDSFYHRASFFLYHQNSPADLRYLGNNSCFDEYNPSTGAQIYCSYCGKWHDHSTFTKIVPDDVERVIVGSLKSRCRTWSVLRGGGWRDLYPHIWEQVKSHQHPGICTAWLIVGTYKLSLGGLNSPELEAAAEYVDRLSRFKKFFCDYCSQKC